MLNNCLSTVEEISSEDSIEEKISLAIDKFIKITGIDLNNTNINDYKNELKDIFYEYLEAEHVNISDIDSLDNIARVAFYRLVKASRVYFYEKNRNSSHDKVESLRIRANNFKRDYELIMISN